MTVRSLNISVFTNKTEMAVALQGELIRAFSQ